MATSIAAYVSNDEIQSQRKKVAIDRRLPKRSSASGGLTMVTGLLRGLDHEDAARFSFLLATPVIFAAGLYKLPDLTGPLGNGIRGQVLVGSVCAGVAAYISVRFLTRWFHTRTHTPFAIYCLIAGVISIVHFA
ncbi:MAG TPA: undecaprenyl-diphosphate phosphatase [Acidimicrobiales bacterium]|nr:undecaprenyl-diphosphate phosphatase [Acidimicrobiales bacterium]